MAEPDTITLDFSAKKRRKCTPLVERFWAQVDKRGPDECWPWTGCYRSNGYGMIARGGRHSQEQAHRISFELHNGPIPATARRADSFVLHSCDNRACVNPAHLRIGSARENTHDMVARGRRYCVSLPGEMHPNAKLTASDVRAIREAAAAGESNREIGRRYGVTGANIYQVVMRKSWAHI